MHQIKLTHRRALRAKQIQPAGEVEGMAMIQEPIHLKDGDAEEVDASRTDEL